MFAPVLSALRDQLSKWDEKQAERRGKPVPVSHIAGLPSVRTLGDLLRVRAQRSGGRPAMYERQSGPDDSGKPSWQAITYEQFLQRAASVARALLELGLARGDRVAVLGPTQASWPIYDFGAQLAGLVSWGIYPQQTVEQIRYLLQHSDTRVVFVDGEAELKTVLEATQDLPFVVAIVPWTEALFAQVRGRDLRLVAPSRFCGPPLSSAEIEEQQSRIHPEGTAILIYTSGTTGPPKGAMISHRNIVSLFSNAHNVQEMFEDDYTYSFLPMAHAAERVFACFGRISAGLPTYFASSTGAVLTEIREVRPTLFGSVPRLFEKAYTKIHTEVERQPRPVRELFAWAVSVGKKRADCILHSRPIPPAIDLQYRVAERLVFSKLRQAFGGRIRYFIVGAAPTPRHVLEFFWAANMPIFEVFGMTEATVVTHGNRVGATKLGTVGRVIPPMQCAIAEDGEVLLRGPWVFKGYFKDEAATAQILTPATEAEGPGGPWLHTGDIGTLDEDGYLRITDRKKHLIITSGGKNLAPANIEAAIKSADPLISHVLACGDNRPYVTALVVPSPLETLEWGAEKGLVSKPDLDARTRELLANPAARSEALNRNMAQVVQHPEFSRRMIDAVRRGNQHLAHVETIRRFILLDRDLSQEHGELTPTMKVKRRELLQRYAERFNQLYDDESFGFSV
ncbi:MAG: long-chain fatty acid--CoA ligase [Myxococcales bacterium]|nr:long-chain fatty acid--CoA ligase [Myxococcales bacterium]